uniref:Uncharacterized protein LOC104215526 n=1 Tax=Nicotiana sylvestris TaxID=4096 RepID=A0A1U7V655_NICSY|nr:PREDICTED: uncharacterized protein LOC104215526 [Nicotiana sylvestris]
MGEFNFFLELQIKQTPSGTMLHQQKYINEILKKFNIDSSKSIYIPIAIARKLDLDKEGKNMEQDCTKEFSCLQEKQFKNSSLPWFLPSVLGNKEAKLSALSTVEAEYVAMTSCCARLLWIRQQLRDYALLQTRLRNCKGVSSLTQDDGTNNEGEWEQEKEHNSEEKKSEDEEESEKENRVQ